MVLRYESVVVQRQLLAFLEQLDRGLVGATVERYEITLHLSVDDRPC